MQNLNESTAYTSSSLPTQFAGDLLGCVAGDRHHDAMYRIDRRRIAGGIYSLLNSATSTVFLLQVSYTKVLRWLRNTETKKHMHSAPNNRYSRRLLMVNGRMRPVDHRMERKIVGTICHRRLSCSTSCSSGPVKAWKQAKNPVSRTAIVYGNRYDSFPGTSRSV
jgi:hypothetical protein